VIGVLYRKARDILQKWKSDGAGKALCVTGARQIGKTTLIRSFAKENYKALLEINFVTEPTAARIFSGDLDAETLVTNLTAYARRSLPRGKTLVFLDEIQECPQARTAIKFLVEDGRFDYIESGSMLGVRHKTVRSYPVGFEELLRMYPMDFEEFAIANGVQNSTIEYLAECFEEKKPVSVSVHETMMKLFNLYLVIGGMPEAVQHFVNNHDVGEVVAYQKDIVEQYRMDVAKYADENDKPKIHAIVDALPAQLNEKNRRFYVNSIGKTARLANYDNSFRWLEEAAVALPCYNVSQPVLPLSLNEKHSLFKLYMNDIGLLCASSLDNVQLELLSGNLEINMGSIVENAIAQQLKANGYALNYFDSKKHGEIDFLLPDGNAVRLIEVKSGNDCKRHKALDNMLAQKEWDISGACILCKGNLQCEDRICYLPLYMCMFLKPNSFPKGLIYNVDLSGLAQHGTETE